MTVTNIGYIIKNSTSCKFDHYRKGYLYYSILIGSSEEGFNRYVFPVEIMDLDGATLSAEEKSITMMRFIRKAISNGMWVKKDDRPHGIV